MKFSICYDKCGEQYYSSAVLKSPWCQYCAILGLWKAQDEDRWGWGGFLLWLQRGGRVYITISSESRNKIEFTINFVHTDRLS